MENIEHIYYINLDYRIDRREEIEKELNNLEIPASKITRISAIHKPDFGILGCGMSHIQTIETFLASPYKTCLILEDDFMFKVDEQQLELSLYAFFNSNIDFDVLMLGGNLFQFEDTNFSFLKKVLDAQTTSAYVLNKSYAETLLARFKESIQLLEKNPEDREQYSLDIYWKSLQKKDRWFQIIPKVGIQRKSYSDIEKKITDYGV